MEEKIYFCLILFSLSSIALYSAHAAVAEILIGFDCRLPAEFCAAAREAALPSRSSGGDWALFFFSHSLNNIPQPNTWKDQLSTSKESLSYKLLIFEALCIMPDFFHFSVQQSAAWESKNILAVHSECVVGCSGRVITVGWKWWTYLIKRLGIVAFLIYAAFNSWFGSILIGQQRFPTNTHTSTLRSFFFIGLCKFGGFVLNAECVWYIIH